MNEKHRKIIENFIGTLGSMSEIVELYRGIRIWLQGAGYTSKTAEKIYELPAYVMRLHSRLTNLIFNLKKDVKVLGIPDSTNIVNEIVKDELSKIDGEFPLVDEIG